jgi:ATP-binding protein involved in chromosome partitioning
MTGVRRLDPNAIAKDVWPQNISPVGRYALHFQWSDGHGSGIYTFEHLRKLAGL